MKLNRLKKRIMIGLIGTAALMAFTGCGKKEAKSIDVKTTANSLLTELKYEDQLSEVNYDLVYDMEDINITESVVYVSSGATAEEIAAIKCETKEDAEKVETALKERVKEQKESFENYVPKELDKLDKAVIVKIGNTVVLSVSNEDAKAKEIIEKASK
ncbi:hypothetical protein GCM10023142_21640 [Anaerocolumna aminovalerica]|jgi:hypothetical protein|uniref:DUF4358 domain-containing protein n=1 Tax=Anaerocolumna aminovalerica TaxID=1527 RepID=A0A1I5DA71_9FIRM|nr:DUF4358 domain-containing protein [Anaerocolumna aminovalerica]MBU5333821.1 DUF4358 domain-containing protein [Anaerocolumna aminovalerica]MDU6263114.1 DUF4358 domain-containing protein [Anaerocolumna aminovalerica]SFN96125.1 protein of unknown function [Anaerocolumna aminovalerica]